MQRLYVFVMCSVMGVLFGMSVLPAHAQLAPTVVFSELNWGGSGRGIADEWFEIANVGAEPVDVGGWSVTGMATGGGLITLPEDAVIPAYSTYLVANYAPSDVSTLAITSDLVTTAVSIPNTKITATLVTADGTVVDSVTDPGTPDYGSSTAPFTSMERDLATLAWQAPTVSANLVDEAQLGTPGFANIPAIDEVTNVIEEPIIIEDVVTPDVLAPTVVLEDNIADVPIVEDVIAEDPVITDDIIEFVPASEPIVDTPIIDVIATEVVDVPIIEITAEPEVVPLEEPVLTEPTFVIDDVFEPTVETVNIEEPEEPTPIEILEVIEEVTIETSPSTTPTETAAAVVEESVDVGGEAVEPVTATIGALQLNELFVDGDEWIEVRNADSHDVDVSGWSVRDASGKATLLGSYVLAPNALLVVDAPKGKLNNDGDVVELFDANGAVVDRVEYGTDTIDAPGADESLTRTADGWFVLTTITKGTTNAEFAIADGNGVAVPSSIEPIASTESAETTASNPTTYVAASNTPAPVVTVDAVTSATSGTPTAAAVATKNVAKSSAPKVGASVKTAGTKTVKKVATTAKKSSATKKKTATTVASIDGLGDGALVRYTGTVIALPDTFGSQMLMLSGAAVYFYHADWPTLAIGDVVTVEGEISTARGERRIKIASAANITLGEHVTPVANDVTTIDATSNAQLVRITGIIGSREGDTLLLTVGDATVRVVASEKSGVHWSSLTGSKVTIIGVVRHIDGEYVLMPRSVDDVTVQHDEVIAPVQNGSNFPTSEVLGGSMLASIAGVLAYWFARSRALIPSV